MKYKQTAAGGTPHKIIMFQRDEHSNWVVELECGHKQRVGRTPLWNYRYWLITPYGRLEYLGQELACSACLLVRANQPLAV